ncbi:transposase [Azoarcus sp. CIB]|uniref:transposase n=1 Tax=Aromatoleum sp. (strain CIB) TaxID=198107 RepID=UPI0006A2AAA3|nr:transposase [Azoarcus sp. CIB]AKU12373.1 transposase [Azoarcus sp. CIB]
MDTCTLNWWAPKRQGRRRHAEEFKQQVIAACLQPGISIAAVALANGLNANLLRRWVKDHRDAQEVEVGAEIADQEKALRRWRHSDSAPAR